MDIRRSVGKTVGLLMIIVVSALGPSVATASSHAAGLPGAKADTVSAAGLPGFARNKVVTAGLPG